MNIIYKDFYELKRYNKVDELNELIKFSAILRDSVHNLDLTDDEHYTIFMKVLRTFIEKFEGKHYEVYNDNRKNPEIGNPTIGIGFNLGKPGSTRRKEALEEWDEAFGNEISLDDVCNGKKLTEEQVEKLFNSNIEYRIEDLKNFYETNWDKLRANEKIGIISAYFNSPRLVNKNSEFYKHMMQYVETGDPEYLRKAIKSFEPSERLIYGLKKRRLVEAEMMNSSKSKFYSRPNEDLLPSRFDKIKVRVGDDIIIPFGFGKKYRTIESHYGIWRTRLDDKVRKEHMAIHGRIIDKRTISPDAEYNCRCNIELLTENLVIFENKLMNLLLIEVE